VEKLMTRQSNRTEKDFYKAKKHLVKNPKVFISTLTNLKNKDNKSA